MVIYEFRTQLLTPTDTPPLVAKASRADVERFIPLAEFGPLFGGYVLWAAPDRPTDAMPGPAIGVWGRRNVERFRRLLGERGAEVERVSGGGPDQALAIVDQDYRYGP